MSTAKTLTQKKQIDDKKKATLTSGQEEEEAQEEEEIIEEQNEQASTPEPHAWQSQEVSSVPSSPSKKYNFGQCLGKRKVPDAYIEKSSKRHPIFTRRRDGAIKKLKNLSVLTHAEWFLVVVSEAGSGFTYSSKMFEKFSEDDLLSLAVHKKLTNIVKTQGHDEKDTNSGAKRRSGKKKSELEKEITKKARQERAKQRRMEKKLAEKKASEGDEPKKTKDDEESVSTNGGQGNANKPPTNADEVPKSTNNKRATGGPSEKAGVETNTGKKKENEKPVSKPSPVGKTNTQRKQASDKSNEPPHKPDGKSTPTQKKAKGKQPKNNKGEEEEEERLRAKPTRKRASASREEEEEEEGAVAKRPSKKKSKAANNVDQDAFSINMFKTTKPAPPKITPIVPQGTLYNAVRISPQKAKVKAPPTPIHVEDDDEEEPEENDDDSDDDEENNEEEGEEEEEEEDESEEERPQPPRKAQQVQRPVSRAKQASKNSK